MSCALRGARRRLRQPEGLRHAGRPELQRAAHPVRVQHYRGHRAHRRTRAGEKEDHAVAADQGLDLHRQGDEGQPGPRAADRRLSSRAVAAAFVGALAVTAAPPPALKVVATHLNNPRKLFVGADGAVYVVEAGTGGRDTCRGTGANETCFGLTGSITRVAHGTQKRVVTGLVSFAPPNGRAAQGPAAVIVRRGTYDVLLQNGSIDSRGVNDLGPDGTTAGDLVSTPPGKASAAVMFNFAAFEAARNPDHGAGPGAKLGDPPIDSDPYAFTAYRGGFAVVDAAGNDLLWLGPKGAVSVLAVFPTQTERLTKAVASKLGHPAMRSISVQSVPSCVAVGPDGALYVGELTGVPY